MARERTVTGSEPIRCFGCGKVMQPSYYRGFFAAIDTEPTTQAAFEKAVKPFVKRYCCGRMVLCNSTIVEDYWHLVKEQPNACIPRPSLSVVDPERDKPVINRFETPRLYAKRKSGRDDDTTQIPDALPKITFTKRRKR